MENHQTKEILDISKQLSTEASVIFENLTLRN